MLLSLPALPDILADMRSITPNRTSRPGRECGVVFTELALTLPLLLLLLVGIYDLSVVLREQVILTEAIRSALRTVVVSVPYQESRYSGTPEERQLKYSEDRYNRAIQTAKYMIRRNGFAEANYYYAMIDVLRTDPFSGKSYPAVQMYISRRSDADFFLLAPGKLSPSCVGGTTLVSGVFIGPDFTVFDPSLDPNCGP